MTEYQREILADLKRFESIEMNDPLFLLERIRKYDFGYFFDKKDGIGERFKPDYYEYKAFIEKLYAIHLDAYFDLIAVSNDRMLRVALKKFAVSFEKKRYDILVRLGDIEIVYEDAGETLKTPTGKSINKEALFALARGYNTLESERDKIRSFFSGAYKAARDFARKRKEANQYASDLNCDVFLAITQAITLLPADAREWYHENVFAAYTWLSHRNRSYEANQASGYVALYLTLFPAPFNLKFLDMAIHEAGENYQSSKFVMQTRYTKWFMEKNHQAALEFFSANSNHKHIGYIIALLADQDCKEALSLLSEKLMKTKDPVMQEILTEAMKRLKNQQGTSPEEERMVWMFESFSPTERALGAETDNVFIQRAGKKHDVHSDIYETDEE